MFQVDHNETNGITIVRLSGKILGGQDSLTVNRLMVDLIDQGKTNVIVDLGDVELMNSSGLGIIIQSANHLKSKNGQLKLANIAEKIQSLLVITKLNTVFETYSTVDEAIKSFAQ
jgi:anti-sigma B factor antagonist